jgi:type II secretory pathway pseudopilin PulG
MVCYLMKSRRIQILNFMRVLLVQTNNRAKTSGFTLMEVLIAFMIFTLVISGMIYGYVQANRIAEFSSMSLGAQSYALQGAEQARAAKWNSQMWPITNGPGTGDELGQTQYTQIDTNDVPTSGAPLLLYDTITITNLSTSPALRLIRSDVTWVFPFTNITNRNTVVTLRAPDQ